jgi:hypothetical protein
MYMRRIVPEEKIPLPSVDKQFMFDDGQDVEELVIRDLKNSGHQVDRQQASFRWDEYQINGKVDGFIYSSFGAFPLEVKGMTWLLPAAKRAAEGRELTIPRIRAVHNIWLLRYAVQLNTYCIGFNYEMGVFAFKNRDTGLIELYGMPIDYDIMEICVQRSETVNAAIAGTGPEPPHCSDPTLCAKCEVCTSCKPPLIQYGPKKTMVDNPALEALLKRREEVKAAASEHKKLTEQINHLTHGMVAICGDWDIRGSWSETPSKTIPEHIDPPSKKWVRKIKRWRTAS